MTMTEPEQTRVEELMCVIAHKKRLIAEALRGESELRQSRETYEDELAAAIASLAEELAVALGSDSGSSLTTLLVGIHKWTPAVKYAVNA